ncbi:MAG: UDP-N-acetylmuramoyl-tripeptide--D-alanyl-D-alanine ligase [bacterium]|nr:UDP-N-acetylmuramoyl-tripeptide--D-alanyl-D-alanine ligase [bacterium]
MIKKQFIHPIKRRIAKYYLILLRKYFGLKVIGITGSAGKTTTKEMLASILKLGGKTVYTVANIDPVYNIPTTILKCNPKTNYLILEMGVEYPGEMDFYLWLAKPDIGVIMNIFPTHTEFFGDINGVFKEKSKLVLSLGKGDIAIMNFKDKTLKGLADKLKAKVFWFESDEDPLQQNANAAGKVAEVLKVRKESIKKGLKTYSRPEHRFEIIKTKSGAVIFDDSYNSNPEALLATLRKFNKFAGKGIKVAVLGDMLELGKIEEDEHRRVGKEIAKSNFRVLIGVGSAVKFLISEVDKYSKKTKTYLFIKPEEALPLLQTLLNRDTFVLIKGSRSIGLDKVVYNLT